MLLKSVKGFLGKAYLSFDTKIMGDELYIFYLIETYLPNMVPREMMDKTVRTSTGLLPQLKTPSKKLA